MSKETFRIYNDRLDPVLWDEDNNLRPEISNQLLKIAQDFYESIEIKPKLHDVLLLGSAAAYNYGSTSDIDVHLVIDFKDLNVPEEDAQKYMDSLKSVWNDKHDIHIKGKNVEIYIQDVHHETHANGIYSLLNAHWVKKPVKEDTSTIDKESIKQKYRDYVCKIKKLTQEPSVDKVKEILNDLYAMRQAGLDATGELSVENITFKLLRHKGWINKLKTIKDGLYDKQMSIDEGIFDDIKIEVETSDKDVKITAISGAQKLGKIVLNKIFMSGYYTIVAFQIFDKANQGMGIGKKLLAAAIIYAKKNNKPIIVQPHPYDNDTNITDLIDIYKHFGFKIWENDKMYMIYDKHLS